MSLDQAQDAALKQFGNIDGSRISVPRSAAEVIRCCAPLKAFMMLVFLVGILLTAFLALNPPHARGKSLDRRQSAGAAITFMCAFEFIPANLLKPEALAPFAIDGQLAIVN